MQDIKVVQDENGFFDFDVSGRDLNHEEGFASAIHVSLFSDARANSDQVKISEQRRGWIGDISSPVEGRLVGSLLWLTEQNRLTQNTLNSIVDYARESLMWIVSDNIASNVEVIGTIEQRKGIILQIDITTIDGDVVTQYVDLWRRT